MVKIKKKGKKIENECYRHETTGTFLLTAITFTSEVFPAF